MRKGIKKAVKIIVGTVSTLLVLLITLPLLASLLINLPAVQNAVVRRVMSNLSGKLGTTVSIDHINVKLINRVVVDGFYVGDFQGDTLLYVKKLTAPIVELGLVGEPLTFGRVKLEGTEMWLRRDSTDTVNIKHIVNAMRGDDYEKKPDSNFRLKIMGIEADSLTFGLLRWDKPFREEGADFSRFVIRNTRVDVDDFSIIKDTIRIGIRELSFDERSGFHVNELSAHDLVIAGGLVSLDNARIRSTGVDLDLPSVRISGSDWYAFRDFLDSVTVDVTMRRSQLTTGFLGWFVPAVGGWGVALDEVSLQTNGPVAAMAGSITGARTLNTSFALDFTSRGMPDFTNMRLDANIHNLKTEGGDIDSLVRSVTGKGLPPSVAAAVKRLGEMTFSGNFNGSLKDFSAVGTLISEAGAVGAQGSALIRAGSTAVDGQVSVPYLELGRVLAVKDLGALSGNFSLNGKLEKGGHIDGEIEGGIGALGFRKYTYRDIAFDGRLDGKMFDGAVRARDPSLDFDFGGELDFNDSIPRYNFDLDLRRADLAAAGINRADSVSLLSGRLTASAGGDGLDNLNGTIEVRGPVYVSLADTVRTDLIKVIGRNSAASKYISLSSEFADAEFRSRISYRDMFAYLGDFLREYLPVLYADTEKPLPAHERNIAAATNYSVLNLNVKNTDRLLAALMPGTHVAEDTRVSFMFNPFVRNFSLSAKSEFIEYRGMLVTGIELNSDNKTDSLTLHLTSEDLYSGSLHIPGLAVHGGSKGRQATLSTRLADAGGNFSAMLGLRIDSEQTGRNRSIRFRTTPSYITLDEKTWIVSARSVMYDTTRVAVDGLRIFSGGRNFNELTVDGVISRSPSDTLYIRLNDFDLSPLGRLVEGLGYDMGGRANGYIDFMSLRQGTRMNAGIDFRGLSLNGAAAAPLRFTSFWDRTAERVRFQMLNQRNNTNVLSGSFAPVKGTIDAVARVDSLDVGLLDPLLGNVLENTRGKANFYLEAGGTFKKLRLDGRVDIPRFETTVAYTQASYVLENGVMTVDNSRLRLPPTQVRDRFGNTADFALTVDMSNLKNIGVDISASVHNLLAVDTGPENNEAFYGQVFATGSLGIKAGKMGTKMGISATTGRGTKFHLPLNAKSNIYWADFVVLADPGRRNVDTTNVLARKKLIYERQLRQGQSSRNKRRKPLDLDITVDLTPDAEFHMLIDPNLGNGISAHGRGVVNMRINPSTNLFSMVGDCSIIDGRFDFSMMDVFNKEFTITPGSTLVWTGEPEDALLNIEASYRVRTSLLPLIGANSAYISGGSSVPVDCVIRLTERLSQPEITFDVRLPSADADAQLIVANAMNTQELKSTQFLSLLMTGNFASNNSLAGQTANSGALATGAVGFDILTNQLSNFLSSEDYNIYFKYRPQSDYIGNQFDVGFSTAFIDNRLLLEIEGNYVDDRAATSVGTSNVSNLAGDVSLTWVIDKAGNVRLKVFSQTIDRLNETQGLQESGLGVYYKKDFDSLGDVWRKNRDTFVNFGSDSVVTKKSKRKANNNK